MSRWQTFNTFLRRLSPPLVAIAAGVCLLIGCIPGSYRNLRDGGVRPEEKIGKAGDGGRPITIGTSTSQRVIEVLGTPRYRTRDGRSLVYLYNVQAGYLLNPLCFRADRMLDSRYLVVRFGEAGVLESFNVYKRLPHAPEFDNLDIPENTRRAYDPK